MAHDREVAGIRCAQVLEKLSEYLDGELDSQTVGRIEAHLKGCDWCERFGKRFSGTVRELRSRLAQPDEVDPRVAARLRDRVDREP